MEKLIWNAVGPFVYTLIFGLVVVGLGYVAVLRETEQWLLYACMAFGVMWNGLHLICLVSIRKQIRKSKTGIL